MTGASQYEVENEIDEEMLNAYLSRTDDILEYTQSRLAVKIAEVMGELMAAMFQA